MNRSLGVAVGLLFVDMVCQSIAYPAMPTLLQDLGQTDAQGGAKLYGLLASSYALAELFGSPILGQVSDRFGRRPVLILAALSSSLAFLVTALATNIGVLFAGYAVAGLTSALLVVVNAVVADSLPPDERARGFGYIGAAVGFGFVLGPAIGGLIGSADLRLPFMVSSAAMLLAAIAVGFLFRESLRPESRSPKMTWRRVLPWESIRSLRAYRLVKRLALTVTLNALALHMLVAVWVPFCTYRYGLGVAENGYLLAVYGLAAAIGQALIVPKAVPMLGVRRALVFGLVVSILGSIGYALAPTVGWMLGIVVVGAFGALDEPSLQEIITGEVGESDQGSVQGGLANLNSLMGIIGPTIGAALFASFSGPQAIANIPGMPFLVGAVLISIGLAAAIRALRQTPRCGSVGTA